MEDKSKLYEIDSEVRKFFVVGDLHGDFRSYEQVVNAWKKERDSSIIFLGDYADRGDHGMEIIESLKKL